MKRLRDPQSALILMFLGIIAIVPLLQAIIETKEGDGIRAFALISQLPTSRHLRSFERSLESANWAGHLTRPWVQFAQFQWLKDGGDKVTVGRGGWVFYKPGLSEMLARPARAKPDIGANDPAAAIINFRDQLAARGIRLLILPVPNKESIYPDRLTSRAGQLRGVLAPRTEELLGQLRTAQVEVVDLFTEFGEARRQGDSTEAPLYLAQDTHWSPAGVNLAVKAVARHLISTDRVQSGPVEYRERPAAVRRVGDIVRMLQVPLLERRVVPENVPCAQVVRSDNGELYKDGADAEVLVMGDSFMRIYQQDEPTAAGFIAHLAKELKRPLMSLVNDGGGATLVRQELHARPVFLENKKVVIWEFVERDIGLGVEGWKLVPLPAAATPATPELSAQRSERVSRAPASPAGVPASACQNFTRLTNKQ